MPVKDIVSDQKNPSRSRALVLGALILILVLLALGSGIVNLQKRHFNFSIGKLSDKVRLFGQNVGPRMGEGKVRVVSEESVTIDVVKRVTPSVVTIGITKNQPVFDIREQDPFDPFGVFSQPRPQGSKQIKQDIGTGFIVQSDGLIITNKHVVADTSAKYRVVTTDNKTFDVQKIYRDPNNDLAILKIETTGLVPVEMGDSSKLQVGQFAIAIGTALGEFRSTVTTGVVSGLGRGITAGTPFEGSEKLENVIQTSAAVNPGNSGGPLLNSSGQVIGVNVAVASGAQNIGFALPINLVKESMKVFEANGQFSPKPYLGVEYQMVTRQMAILNEIPEGAYVRTVVSGGPAEKAGVNDDDIITKIDGKKVADNDGGLAAIISGKKVGDQVELTVYRGSETLTLRVTLEGAPQ
jgi:S1-C subfamily serine protease